tara:strand:- start:6772 stop:7098 length:327 start_codon:yes stop_codon:yes gene_type:complete
MLPSLNISVDAKNAIIAAVALCAAGSFFLIGYLTGHVPEEVMCKLHIEQTRVLNIQVKDLEKELSTAKDIYTVACIKREKEICADLVKTTTDNIKKLRCRICQSEGVR